jgi:competence protein ComEC
MPPLLLLGLAWLAGLALARLPEPRLGLLWLAVAAPLALLFRRRLPLAWPLALAALSVAALGLWRGWPAPVEAPPALPSGIAAVRGTVASWPRAGQRETRATLTVDQVEVGGAWRPLAASLAARLPLFPAVELGDRVEVRGPARGLAALDDRRAADGLRRQGLAGEVSGRRVTVLAATAAVPTARREPVVAAVARVLDRALPIPVAGLAAGLLLGERGGLPAELRAAFAATGTAHLLVVSGWNMTLVVAAVGWLGARLRLRHHPVGLPPALLAIAGYTWLVGAEPPVVRAALMGGLAATALALGRRADPLVALVGAAAVMAGAEPGLLGDLGFQLSFLATLGLLLALPPLAPRLAALPLPARLAAEPLAATVAAQLAVEPLLAHTFGRISPLAPLVNVLVAPWVPLVMAGAASVALLGLVAAALGQPGVPLLSELAGGLTTLAATPLLAVVEAGARLPFASVSLPAPPLSVTLALYGLLALLGLPLLTPAPAATVRQVWQAGRAALPALGLAGLALGAGLVWLALVG